MIPLFRCLILLLICAASHARADAFAEAAALHADGKFAAAAARWEELIRAEGPSAARLYNLGNARAKEEDFGQAILAYERALLLAPRDPDILANLALARKNARVSLPPRRPWWHEPFHLLSRNEWSWLIATGSVILAAGLLACGILGFRTPTGRRIALISGIAAALTILPGTSALLLRRTETSRSILTARQPVLRLSPFDKAEKVGQPSSGETAVPGARARGWVQVTLPGTGSTGWVPESEVASVVSGK